MKRAHSQVKRTTESSQRPLPVRCLMTCLDGYLDVLRYLAHGILDTIGGAQHAEKPTLPRQKRIVRGVIAWLFVGLTALGALVAANTVGQQVGELQSAVHTAAALQAAADGQPVVIEGRIAPSSAVGRDDAGFVVYDILRQNTATSRKIWMAAGSVYHSFALDLQDGSVVVAKSEQGSLSLQKYASTSAGDRRFDGFRAGDAVLVIGTVRQGEVVPTELIGGTLADRLHELQVVQALPLGWLVLELVGLLLLLGHQVLGSGTRRLAHV